MFRFSLETVLLPVLHNRITWARRNKVELGVKAEFPQLHTGLSK